VHSPSQRAFALVGPGRAGTTIALALTARGFRCVGVAGRAPDAPSTVAVAEQLGAPALAVADAGWGGDEPAELVLIATPDAEIAATAASLAASLAPGTLVLHLSGACSTAELDKLRTARSDVRLGSLHPLQTLPSPEAGRDRLPGSWCAVDGPDDVERLALTLGMRPFRVADEHRATYHATATIASNHLVALLGQVERVAADAGVPPEALLPLVRATLDNVEAHGPAAALTGPVARGDADTVARHLDALPVDERDAYRALAREALRLSGRDDAALHALLDSDAGPAVESRA
jgi:predicted short-subunit dehydrogenase-like oxidoreductase (DUF2520 family)